MGVYKVIIDYSKESDDRLSVLSESIYSCLNPNTNFTWETMVMPLFRGHIDEYRSCLEKVPAGTSADVIKKNMARKVLLIDFHDIGTEVNYQAAGDLVKLQSSGFLLAKIPSKVGLLPKPTGFEVTSGDNSGDFLCNVKAYSKAKMYLFISAPVPSPANFIDWRQSSSSAHKTNIQGFVPGKQYELKCAYLGTEKELVYSDSIFIYAQ
jgi:hypothetical protein